MPGSNIADTMGDKLLDDMLTAVYGFAIHSKLTIAAFCGEATFTVHAKNTKNV